MAAAVLAAATGTTFSAAGPAQAAESCAVSGQPCVIFHVQPSGQTFELSRDQLAAAQDRSGAVYTLRGSSGGAGTPWPIAIGTSVAAALEAVHLDPKYVAGVTLQGHGVPSGSQSASLTGPEVQLANPPFAEGLLPVLYLNGPADSSINYFRPLRDNPTDTNAVESLLNSGDNGVIDLAVDAGPTVTVQIHASTLNPKPGGSVTFTATTNANTPVFTWDLDRATPSPAPHGSHVTQVFTGKAGDSFRVKVSVAGANGTSGVSSPLVVKIGKSPASGNTHAPGTGTSHDPNAPATGPTSSHGTNVGAAASNQTRRGTTTRPQTPALDAPTQVTAGGVDLSLPLITGQLIGSTEPVSSAGLAAEELDSATAPGARTPPDDRVTLPAWIGVVAGLVALFGFGVLSEVRPNLRRRKS